MCSCCRLNFGSNFWLGLRTNQPCTCRPQRADSQACKTCRDSWYWEDGEQSYFRNWKEDQPYYDFENRRCSRMQVSGLWYDAGCEESFNYVCEKRKYYPCQLLQLQLQSMLLIRGSKCKTSKLYLSSFKFYFECKTHKGVNKNFSREGQSLRGIFRISKGEGQRPDFCIAIFSDTTATGHPSEECRQTTCANGGSCMNRNGDEYCVCLDGFTGDRCQYTVGKNRAQCSTTKVV